MTVIEPATTAYLSRRSVSMQWRGFLRGLIETLDTHLDVASRSALMRSVGARMAAASPLPACASLSELEGRMNDALAVMEWGYVELSLDAAQRALLVTHAAAPVVAVENDAEGGWLMAVLEGLHTAWLGAQPGADPAVTARITAFAPGEARLRYGVSVPENG
jgi:hypothetical protein